MKVTADCPGESISLNRGRILLRAVERQLTLTETLAGGIRLWRDPVSVVHTLVSCACGQAEDLV